MDLYNENYIYYVDLDDVDVCNYTSSYGLPPWAYRIASYLKPNMEIENPLKGYGVSIHETKLVLAQPIKN